MVMRRRKDQRTASSFSKTERWLFSRRIGSLLRGAARGFRRGVDRADAARVALLRGEKDVPRDRRRRLRSADAVLDHHGDDVLRRFDGPVADEKRVVAEFP